jgi:LysM repeat protein
VTATVRPARLPVRGPSGRLGGGTDALPRVPGPVVPAAGPPRSRRSRWALLAVAALGLAACGGDDGDPPRTPDDVLTVVTPTAGAPPPRTPTPVPAEQRYVVREGDSLSAIATRFGVSEEAIRQANNLADPNAIFVGQELIIPPPEP